MPLYSLCICVVTDINHNVWIRSMLWWIEHVYPYGVTLRASTSLDRKRGKQRKEQAWSEEWDELRNHYFISYCVHTAIWADNNHGVFATVLSVSWAPNLYMLHRSHNTPTAVAYAEWNSVLRQSDTHILGRHRFTRTYTNKRSSSEHTHTDCVCHTIIFNNCAIELMFVAVTPTLQGHARTSIRHVFQTELCAQCDVFESKPGRFQGNLKDKLDVATNIKLFYILCCNYYLFPAF